MIKRIGAVAALMTTALAALAASARPAEAQLGFTFYSVGEFDTNDVVLALAGVTVSPRRTGWTPTAGLQAYWLRFPIGTVDKTVISLTPSVGLRNGFGTGSVSFRVGYSFSDAEIEGSPGVAADIGDGVVNSVQLDYWGTGKLGAQAIASYNYGSENLWARGRLTQRLMGYGDAGQIRVGAEVAYLNGNNYSSIQPGVLVGFHPSAGTIINLGVGRRFNDGEDATYFKAELVLIPR